MRRREFLRGLAGVAAAPVAVAVGLAKPKLKPKRDTAMAENFRRTYGPKGWGKTHFHAVSNYERQMLIAMRQQHELNAKMISTMERNGFRYIARVHDGVEFEMLKGGRS